MNKGITQGKIKTDKDIVPEVRQFQSIDNGIEFARSMVKNASSNDRIVFFELCSGNQTVILQSQRSGHFLQVFTPDASGLEGWFNAVNDEKHSYDDDELIVPCFEHDAEITKDYYQIIGIEGTWASKKLFLEKNNILNRLNDVDKLNNNGKPLSSPHWKNLGLL